MMRFQVVVILLISFQLSAQKGIPFSGSIYSSPRFIEDSLLTNSQSKRALKKKFKQKVVKMIKDYVENPIKNDSVKRATLGVYIDSLGIARFKYERPVGSFKPSFIELFKKAIDSMPQLIPAKMRTKNVGVSYGLLIWNPDYLVDKKTD